MVITGGGRRRCRVCGADHAACGPATSTTPVDARVVMKESSVGELRTYKARVNGMDTTLKLTEEDAKNLYPDAELVSESGGEQATAPSQKNRLAANKARATVENK